MKRLQTSFSKTLSIAVVAAITAFGSEVVANEITLNLQDADITSLIATVSEVTGQNFIIDPRVKGKVTVLSSSPMDQSALYETFLSILQVHGYAAITSGSVTKIVPETGAKQDGGVGLSSRGIGPDDELVTRVLEIQNVPAAQLVPILRPLVPQYGHLAAYPPSNMLILSDRAVNVTRLERIIRSIDQGGDREIEIIKLEFASATDVVRIVTSISQQKGATPDPTSKPVTAIADERTNSIIIGGDKADRLRMKTLISYLDISSDDDGSTQVVYLRYASAEKIAPILEGYAKENEKAESAKPGASTTRVIAEPDTNALVITASPKSLRALRSIIDQLDIRRAQVLVEAIIAEVSISKSRQLGIDLALLNNEQIAFSSIFDPASIGAIGTALATSALPNPSSLTGFTAGGGVGDRNGTSFGLLLRALSGDGDTNILSTPTIVTMDNEEAEFSVGQEVPFLTGSFTGTGGTGGSVNPFQTIERKDVGLTLKLTPQISEGDTVQLEISQEISSLSQGSLAGASDLITNKRKINTTVMLDDGDILVLGGLIQNELQEQEDAVPVLGKIPFLGALFRSTSIKSDRRNLMIFIRPVILRDPDNANFYTKQKYNQIRDLQLERNGRNIALSVQEDRPLLYEIDQFDQAKPVEKRMIEAGAPTVTSESVAAPQSPAPNRSADSPAQQPSAQSPVGSPAESTAPRSQSTDSTPPDTGSDESEPLLERLPYDPKPRRSGPRRDH